MSKTAFYFALYDYDKSEKLNNVDLHTMATEFFWLMSTLEVKFDAWDTIYNFITLIVEQNNSKEVVDEILKVLQQDDNNSPPEDSTWFANHVLMIHNAFMGPEAPPVEITLPVLRMIILTDDRIDQFIQTILPKSFKLEKAPAERQKGLGHEIFEALFIEGRKLATNMSLPVPPDSASTGIHLSPTDNNIKRRSPSISGSPRLPPSSSTPRSIKSSASSSHSINNSATDADKRSYKSKEEEDDYEIV